MANWEDLPDELRLQILECLMFTASQRFHLATICRKWQHIVESFTFEEIHVRVSPDTIASGTISPRTLQNTLYGRRLRNLKTLSLTVDCYEYPFPCKPALQTVAIVDAFVDTLKGWRSADANLHLKVWEPPSLRHNLLLCWSKLLRDKQTSSIDCVHSLTTTSDVNRSDHNYNMSGRSLSTIILGAMSENMRSLSNAYVGFHHIARRFCISGIPLGITSLSIHDTNLSDPYRVATRPRARSIFEELSYMKLKLETLHISCYSHDSADRYFEKDTSVESLPQVGTWWVKLRQLSLNCVSDGWHEDWANRTLGPLATIAGTLPALRSLEVWNVNRRNYAHARFRYAASETSATALLEVVDEDFHADHDLLVRWHASSKLHSSCPLQFEVRAGNGVVLDYQKECPQFDIVRDVFGFAIPF